MLKRGFNTSHVTLYLPASHPLKLFLRRFNTSHVTLYHRPAFQKRCGFLVSIHLMLLFIGHAQIQNAFNILFQYISCYSLSQKRFSLSCFCTGFQYISCYSLSDFCPAFFYFPFVSIHLMLLFIRNPARTGYRYSCVSIHLMLLFIPAP